jgi:membrane protein YqaA with SNARE-associated domain
MFSVRSLSRFAFGIFLSAGGLFILAALDSTIFFFFPFGIDAAVIVLTVRHHGFAWPYPILATAGSAAGSIITFWMGRKIGEAGLERYMSKRRLESVMRSVRMKGATTLALFAIVPPPFPFTAVVLAAGALEADALRFLGVTAGVRLVRFGAEAVLAAIYGRSVLRWMNSDTVQDVVAGIIVLAVVGSVISLFALRRRSTIPYSASRPQYRSP